MMGQTLKHNAVIDTPVGPLGILMMCESLFKIHFLEKSSPLIPPTTMISTQICQQLENYFFHNPKHIFDLPLFISGTDLQKKVWMALRSIPSGKTVTYGELADQIGTHPRVIGNACRANPIPVIIPCHRVVLKGGLGGFCGRKTGYFMQIKKWLLGYEKLSQ